MNEHTTPIEDLVANSSRKGKVPRARKLLIFLFALWLITFAGLLIFGWNAYFQKKQQAQSLAQQVTQACKSRDFGPGFSKDQEDKLCDKAETVAKDNGYVSLPIQGPRGPEGPEGPPGPQGVPGIMGPQGLRGIMGVKGKPGEDGQPGATGPQGEKGDPGAEGPIGPKGETGSVGPKGDTGAEGPMGPSGLINFTAVGCEGPLIHSIAVSYDAETKTATITCN